MNFNTFGLYCAGIIAIFVMSSLCQDHPNNIQVSSGESVGLICLFEHQVEICWWTINGNRVNKSDRYRFTDGEPFSTTSCTLQIRNADPKHDAGHWECLYREQVQDEARTKNGFHLSITSHPPEHKEFVDVKTSSNGVGSCHKWIAGILIATSCLFHVGLQMT